MSHFGQSSERRCWNALVRQKTYVLLLQPCYSGPSHFKGRYDDDLGAAIDFTLQMERNLLKAQGEFSYFLRSRIYYLGGNLLIFF